MPFLIFSWSTKHCVQILKDYLQEILWRKMKFYRINIITTHADWLAEWGTLRARACSLSDWWRVRACSLSDWWWGRALKFVHCAGVLSLSLSLSFSLIGKEGLCGRAFWRKREGERDRERETGREREGGRGRGSVGRCRISSEWRVPWHLLVNLLKKRIDRFKHHSKVVNRMLQY